MIQFEVGYMGGLYAKFEGNLALRQLKIATPGAQHTAERLLRSGFATRDGAFPMALSSG